MITWADAHIRAATLAAEAQADLKIPLDRPVDVFGAIERMGLVLAFADLGGVSGLYLPGQPSTGILLHAGHPRTRQRYTAGHELGHHVFGHAADLDVELEDSLQRGDDETWPDREKEAEAFGAWFLMPRRLLRAGLQDLGIDHVETPFHVYSLALWLGTSYVATARQLGVTRLVSMAASQRWARIPPRQIKMALAGSYAPDHLRNDVWWLEGRSAERLVEARPGDRLVVTMQEIPSSGFSWRVADLPAGVRLVADSFVDAWGAASDSVNGDSDHELAGGCEPRSFVLEVDHKAHQGLESVTFIKDQPWDPASPRESVDVTVSVNPPLRGIQLPEADFALAS